MSSPGIIDGWLVNIVREIGAAAKDRGWTLRSGGADGMDLLFEYFWTGAKEIYIPWPGFNNRQPGVHGAVYVTDPVVCKAAEAIAKQVHPAWSNLRSGGKTLHTRNVFQVLGESINSPSDVCVYYADVGYTGEVKGGTRTAVELSKLNNVPTFNLKMTQDVIDLGILLELQWNNATPTTVTPTIKQSTNSSAPVKAQAHFEIKISSHTGA